jgi:hypothetical protein
LTPDEAEDRATIYAAMMEAIRAGDRITADRIWRWELAPLVRAAQEERAKKLVGQEDLVASIERLLFEEDPININFGSNEDEYRAEAETITLRLPEAADEGQLLRIVHEEFVWWFGDDTAGSVDRYESPASKIWSLTHEKPAQ